MTLFYTRNLTKVNLWPYVTCSLCSYHHSKLTVLISIAFLSPRWYYTSYASQAWFLLNELIWYRLIYGNSPLCVTIYLRPYNQKVF